MREPAEEHVSLISCIQEKICFDIGASIEQIMFQNLIQFFIDDVNIFEIFIATKDMNIKSNTMLFNISIIIQTGSYRVFS